jgi:hypothetical protein
MLADIEILQHPERRNRRPHPRGGRHPQTPHRAPS